MGMAFAQRHHGQFPAGIYHVYAVPDRPLAQSIAETVSHPSAPYLLVLDELERRPQAGLSREIQAIRRKRPSARLLCLGVGVRLDRIADVSLELGGLTRPDVDMLLHLVLRAQRNGDTAAFESLKRNPLLTHEVSQLLQSPSMTPRELLLKLRSFAYSGLVGVDGKPLRAGGEAERQIIVDVQVVNDDLLRRVQADPSLLRQISSRRFEEFVAEVLDRLGYTVELTPPSKDGGFDIYAVRKEHLGRFLYLVECKQRAPGNRIGVELVRALSGVVHEKQANAGVLVTTSSFTKGAKELQRRIEHQMTLTDYLELQGWLDTALSDQGAITRPR